MSRNTPGAKSPSDDSTLQNRPLTAGKRIQPTTSAHPRPEVFRGHNRGGIEYTFTEPVAQLYANRSRDSESGRVGRPTTLESTQGARLSAERRAMVHTRPDTKRPRSRSDVRSKYGHPWPWMAEDILREQLVDRGLSADECAEEFLCIPETIRRKAREFGIDLGADG